MSKAEEFIQENTMNCSNELAFSKQYARWISPEQGLEAIDIAREEELEYVKYQLELRLPETLDYNGIKVNRKDFINDFTKAMKDD